MAAERIRYPLERGQAEPDLEHRNQQQHDGEHAEGHQQGTVEGARLVFDFLRIAGDRDQKSTVVAEIDHALDEAQPLLLGTGRIGAPGIVRADRRIVAELR